MINITKENPKCLIEIGNKTILENQIESLITNYIEKIHDALILGIRDYFNKMNFNRATLGLSGGIDSSIG